MTNIPALFKAISALHDKTGDMDLVSAVPNFPYPTMYRGQGEILNSLAGFSQAAIASPTGTGKTAVYLTLTRGVPSLVISPRKFLQKQVQSYFSDFVLFGRSEYKCHFAKTAANAPCNRKADCLGMNPPTDCQTAKETCSGKECKVFSTTSGMIKFPCKGCDYLAATIEAKRVLKSGGTVICNFGNFWQLLKHAKIVVIDEADLFFREISKPTKLLYSDKKNSDDTIPVLLQREKRGLETAIEKSAASAAYSLTNKLYDVEFLIANQELCFKYQRRDKIYIEINPVNVSVLKDKIFHGKRLLIVSATLGDFDIPRYSYSVFQRRGVFFCPVDKMTSTNFKKNPWIMKVAAERIDTIASIAEGLYDTAKFPIHCGNLGTHAYAINNHLGPDRDNLYCNACGEKITNIEPEEIEVECPKCGRKWVAKEDVCTLHKSGNLMQTIENFVENDKRYLLIAGADYGGDFSWAKVQFVLKFPYAAMDERHRVLERVMGKQEFNKYYINDAISRFVQECGRTCRGAGDFGVTIVLDSKFMDVWNMNRTSFPDWFAGSFDGKWY